MTHARFRTLLLSVAWAIGAVLIASPAAFAGPGDFSSSFEDGDPAPTWTNTVDTDASGNERTAGVTGPKRSGLPGDVTDKVVAVEANGENEGVRRGRREPRRRLRADQVARVRSGPAGSSSSCPQPVKVVHYALISANDARRTRPEGLDAVGLRRRRRTWTRCSTPRPARTSPSASRPRSTGSRTRPPTSTTGSTSPRTTAPTSSSSPRSSSPTATRRPRRRPT